MSVTSIKHKMCYIYYRTIITINANIPTNNAPSAVSAA